MRGNPNIVQMLGMCNTTVVTEAFPMDIQNAMKKRAGDLPVLDAVVMSLDAAKGLQALHEASIVHYDMKPAQMLVTYRKRHSDQLRVKLNDFNVAFFMSSRPDGNPCPFRVRGGLQLGPWRTPEYLAQKVSQSRRPGAPSLTRPAWRRGRLLLQSRAAFASIFAATQNSDEQYPGMEITAFRWSTRGVPETRFDPFFLAGPM